MRNRQRLAKSLLSGSESEEGSCGTTPYSIPYLLRSAADAASAAIDYSKGDIEDGVVDSPPSRGFVRTLACSPSPLKRASPTPGNCFSPTPRTGEGTSRKLDLLPVEAPEHHPLVAAVTSSPVLKDVSDGFTEACAKSLLQHRIRVQPEPRPHLAKSTATSVANT